MRGGYAVNITVKEEVEGWDFVLVDNKEALVAKEYFSFFHEGLNRRTEDPVNSRLNYGYAIVVFRENLAPSTLLILVSLYSEDRINEVWGLNAPKLVIYLYAIAKT